MLSHVFLGISDFERALGFYQPLMKALGIEPRFCDPGKSWAGWQSSPDPRPLFAIGKPFDGDPARSGNGAMVAFLAERRALVDEVHALALSLGGSDEGAPGLRPHYHPNYYGAYFRDPDGNKLCVVCHSAED